MATIGAASGHGMILGKFMPPHAGHQYLIEFARAFVERLTVLVCSIRSEPIPGDLRFGWMQELFPGVRTIHVTDELPQEPSENPRFWDLWRETIRRVIPEPIDFVFASEDYGYRLAAELDSTFIPVDVARRVVPVSGTAIRTKPTEQWRHVPPCVRPYFVKRVCLFGPESTGKSTLARQLADHFHTIYVPEFARDWLDPKGGVCSPDDIAFIVRGQIASEEALARQANRVLFCDTDTLTTKVWSEVLFGESPIGLDELSQRRRYELTLLLDVDVPWVDDRQRFLQDSRQEFLNRCRQVLIRSGRHFVTIRGSWDERLAAACAAVEELLRG